MWASSKLPGWVSEILGVLLSSDLVGHIVGSIGESNNWVRISRCGNKGIHDSGAASSGGCASLEVVEGGLRSGEWSIVPVVRYVFRSQGVSVCPKLV